MDYRYSLKKGGKKFICPSCGDKRKTFVPYVDEHKNIVDVTKYGRCERINSCGYCEYPKTNPNEFRPPKDVVYIPPKLPDYIKKEIVEKTFSDFRNNIFMQFLIKTFDGQIAMELQEKYNIGTTKNGGTIFWQQDRWQRFRTGKVITYTQNGHRDKNRLPWFIHSKLKNDFNLQQCFFGLHLVDGTKPVALCESEKTAVMMSIFNPDFIWIASGGSEMLSTERLAELPRLDKVFADNGQFALWEEKTRNFAGRQMDVSVDNAVIDGVLENGSDILDLVLYNKNLQP